jgi:hypothetical protein
LPEQAACAVDNFDSTKITVVASLVTDIGLLLIMLIGLLRFRLESSGAMNLAHILWNQVQWLHLPLTVIFLKLNFCCKGLIWLLVATIAEVPASVRLAPFSPVLFAHKYFTSDVHDFELEW